MSMRIVEALFQIKIKSFLFTHYLKKNIIYDKNHLELTFYIIQFKVFKILI